MVSKEMMFFKKNKKDDSKVDLEINLLKKINIQHLFDKVTTMPLKFKYPHMSLDEDTVNFTQGPKEILVSGKGRIWINGCKNNEDAIFMLNEIEALL